MKRIFCVVVCVATSFLYSMDEHKPHPTPKISPLKPSHQHIKITFPNKNRPRIDSDPIIKLVQTNESRPAVTIEEKK